MRFLATGVVALVISALCCGVSDAQTYTVSPGDTVTSIARAHDISVAELARLNQLEGTDLRPGTVLVLDAQSAHVLDPAEAAAARDRALAAEAAFVPKEEGTDLAFWAPGASDGKIAADKSALRRLAEGIANRTSLIAVRLTKSAMRFLGVPYVFGGTTTRGFDCSGYVQHVFAMLGIHLPRTADAQYEVGHKVKKIEPGDLVFFQTYTAGPSHVGIYLGQGRFVHSSSSHGVEVSELHDAYWSARYLGAKRILVASRN
ncbi:MAG: C40 family peptidase [Vulcanimicrobiaceae bacterium]